MMTPYRRRYTVWMRLQDNALFIAQVVAVAMLLLGMTWAYTPAPAAEEMTVNDAIASCQTRGYFNVGTVHVQCQVRE